MSKSILGSATPVSSLTDVLKTVVGPLPSQTKGGSSRIQSGLQAMFDKAKAEGYEAGRAEGHADGLAIGTAKGWNEVHEAEAASLAEFQQALQGFVEKSSSAIDEWYRNSEESLTSLAIEIARRAIEKELEISRDSVLEITKSALSEVRHGTSVRIKVNPVDCAILESKRNEVISAASGIRDLEVVMDGSIQAGCVIETDGGVIDARIESFLHRISQEAA